MKRKKKKKTEYTCSFPGESWRRLGGAFCTPLDNVQEAQEQYLHIVGDQEM
jgi:hypothetical protein